MSKKGIVHFRVYVFCDGTACNKYLNPNRVNSSVLPRKVTCKNCMRTGVYKRIHAKFDFSGNTKELKTSGDQ